MIFLNLPCLTLLHPPRLPSAAARSHGCGAARPRAMGGDGGFRARFLRRPALRLRHPNSALRVSLVCSHRRSGQLRHADHLRAGRYRSGLSFRPRRTAAHSDSHHPGLFHRLRRIGLGHRPWDLHFLAIHGRIRTGRRMVGRRGAGGRKLVAANIAPKPSR